MRVLARVKEVVVEGRATFHARQLEERLKELLEGVELDAHGNVDIGEVVVEAPPTLHGAAEATVRALAEHLRTARGR